METILQAINVEYDDEKDIVIFTEPDYGDGNIVIAMPFNQLRSIYERIYNIRSK